MPDRPSKTLVITTDRYDLDWEMSEIARVPDVKIKLVAGSPRSADELAELASSADALLISSREPVTRQIIEQMPNCGLIGRYSVGIDAVDVDAATEYGIIVTHVPDYCTNEVADHAMSLILALNRRTVELDRDLRVGGWLEHAHYTNRILRGPVHPLRTQTLGIIGFGRIGQAVARRAQAFGLRLIASDPLGDAATLKLLGVDLLPLDDLLEAADIVSIHAPLTAETHHLLDARRLDLLKPGALIVNTARGPIIDLDALTTRLQNHSVAGAGLDVVHPEPLPSDSPLYHIPTVILTPHSAYYSELSSQIVRREGLAEAIRVLRGMQPRTIANPGVIPRLHLTPYIGPSEPGAGWQSGLAI